MVHTQEFNFSEQIAYANNLASVNGSDANLTIWDTSDSQTIYANYSVFYANYTNSTGSVINGSGVYCEFMHNKTRTWKDLINMSFNPSTSQYELIADNGYIQNSTESHRAAMPYGNYSFNISCYNNLGYNNLSAVDSVNISSYSTSLSIENDTGKVTNEQVYFYANYSSDLMPVTGIGLSGYEIGQVIS